MKNTRRAVKLEVSGKQRQLLALIAFLAIPAIVLAGGAIFAAIDPERLAGHAHYVRDFNLLQLGRSVAFLAMMGLAAVLWFVTCYLVIRSKGRTWRWMVLALLGPVGFPILAALRDLSPEPDLYERFCSRQSGFHRVMYEVCCFVLIVSLAWGLMIAKREATISYESAVKGVPRSQIVDERNASSGMWAFSEGNDVMYLTVLLYLLRPLCVNVAGSLLGSGRSPNRT